MINSLDPVVDRKIDAMKEQADAAAEGLANRGQPITDTTEPNPDFDRMNPSSLHDQFKRATLQQQYTQMRTQPESGTFAEVTVVKLQHEFLAELERSFQLRCRSRLASVALAASTRKMAGDAVGILEAIRADLKQPLKNGTT